MVRDMINGTLITQTMKTKGVKRAPLARECGCDTKTIWNAEHGRNVNTYTLIKIADALDLSLDALRMPAPDAESEAVA
jgi:transcriptional regulator with XRE-family HTH domain